MTGQYGKREIFFLNLEDGYFGCQVNASTEVLQLFDLSKLCDGEPQCFQGSDENSIKLKCQDRSKFLNLIYQFNTSYSRILGFYIVKTHLSTM